MTTEMLSSTSVRAAPCQDRGHRLNEDRDVHPERPVLEVVEVEPDEVIEAEVRAARDLPEARDAGEDVVPRPMPVLELGVIPEREGARPDQAHRAAKDVQELGNLVEREAPEQRSDRCHPR